ncbi:hypothetical protein N7504_011114 [Penicillium tannophilum]|nr:hypothetical protein N7504_011114 [Penicillium tannophilum]
MTSDPPKSPREMTCTEPSQTAKKAKRFLCIYCHRRFTRLEHLQRHERTPSQILWKSLLAVRNVNSDFREGNRSIFVHDIYIPYLLVAILQTTAPDISLVTS